MYDKRNNATDCNGRHFETSGETETAHLRITRLLQRVSLSLCEPRSASDRVNGYRRPETRFRSENLTAADVKLTLGLLILSCPFGN